MFQTIWFITNGFNRFWVSFTVLLMARYNWHLLYVASRVFRWKSRCVSVYLLVSNGYTYWVIVVYHGVLLIYPINRFIPYSRSLQNVYRIFFYLPTEFFASLLAICFQLQFFLYVCLCCSISVVSFCMCLYPVLIIW